MLNNFKKIFFNKQIKNSFLNTRKFNFNSNKNTEQKITDHKNQENQEIKANPLKEKYFNFDTLENQINLSLNSLRKLYSNINGTPVRPDIKPGQIFDKLIDQYPEESVDFKDVLGEIEKEVYPNLCNWQHPAFFAYFGAPIGHDAINLEMLLTAVHSPNFNWNVSPAAHELEWIVTEWAIKMLGLDSKFSFANGGCGGCPGSTSEGNFMSVNLAKYKKIKELQLSPLDERRLKLVAYYPEYNKDWAGKALFLKDINFNRCLKVHYNEEIGNYVIDPEELKNQIEKDIEEGLIPCWFGGQIGGTMCLPEDTMETIGPILKKYNIYYHIDAAYSGMFWSFPENRPKGLEYANSIIVNPVKTGLAANPSAMMFADDKESYLESTGLINGEIYSTNKAGIKIDYKDFQVGFGRRLNGIKMYGLFRLIGVSGFKEYLNNVITRGEYFSKLIKNNPRFEIFVKPKYGLVCFRYIPLKFDENLSKEENYNKINIKFMELMDKNTEEGMISASSISGKKFLRFVSGNIHTDFSNIDRCYNKILRVMETVESE